MAHVINSRSRIAKPLSRRPTKSGADRRHEAPIRQDVRPGAHIPRRHSAQQLRTPRQERAIQTVDAVVSAAARLLVEQGYAAISTNSIAERAGVSIGSIYQYFHDKNDVFRAMVRRHRQEVMPVITETIERMRAPRADIVELTLELLRRMALVNGHDPRLLAAIDRELGWLEHEDEGEAEVLETVSAVLRERLQHHPYSAEIVATLMVTIVAPLSRWMVHSKPTHLDSEQLISAFGCMLRGLLEARAIRAS